MTCAHENFDAAVVVDRIADRGAFVADLQIRCTNCRTRFAFKGVRAGLSFDRPTVSLSGLELHAPIEPAPHETSMLGDDPDLAFPTPEFLDERRRQIEGDA